MLKADGVKKKYLTKYIAQNDRKYCLLEIQLLNHLCEQ